MAKGGPGRNPKKHPHGYSSHPNMWRDPKTVNANKGCAITALALASAPVALVVMTGGYFMNWWG